MFLLINFGCFLSDFFPTAILTVSTIGEATLLTIDEI